MFRLTVLVHPVTAVICSKKKENKRITSLECRIGASGGLNSFFFNGSFQVLRSWVFT